MDAKTRERCVELVYKIVNSEDGVFLVDNDLNFYLNKSDELKELCSLFNKDNKYEVNYICGLFCMSESDLSSLQEWKEEYLQDDEYSYWRRCLGDFDMKEEWLLEYNQEFIRNNYIERK